jgi:mRNA interferase MazF
MVKKLAFKRFDVVLVKLDPTQGSELKKTRPCLIISPDSMNESRLATLIVAPLTSKVHLGYPTRILTVFQDKKGQVALDQLRVIDRSRIVKIVGNISNKFFQETILNTLQLMFS